jgi:GxxExxY protein
MEIDTSYVDEDMEPDPELNRLTNAIIGAAIEVHTLLKAGLLEFLYEQALAIEFTRRKIPFQRQVIVPVYYKGELIGEQRIDFIVDGKVVVDLKTVEQFAPIHTAQMLCYLQLTQCRLGLLINFKVRALKDGIKRIAR